MNIIDFEPKRFNEKDDTLEYEVKLFKLKGGTFLYVRVFSVKYNCQIQEEMFPLRKANDNPL